MVVSTEAKAHENEQLLNEERSVMPSGCAFCGLTVFWFVISVCCAFSALTLLVGRQEGHPACKKLSGGVLAWLSVWSKVQTCIWPS